MLSSWHFYDVTYPASLRTWSWSLFSSFNASLVVAYVCITVSFFVFRVKSYLSKSLVIGINSIKALFALALIIRVSPPWLLRIPMFHQFAVILIRSRHIFSTSISVCLHLLGHLRRPSVLYRGLYVPETDSSLQPIGLLAFRAPVSFRPRTSFQPSSKSPSLCCIVAYTSHFCNSQPFIRQGSNSLQSGGPRNHNVSK